MTDETIIRKIRFGIMRNDSFALEKSLWRLSGGSYSKACEIIRASARHYGMTPEEIQDVHIDTALSELNGGTEVEWYKE